MAWSEQTSLCFQTCMLWSTRCAKPHTQRDGKMVEVPFETHTFLIAKIWLPRHNRVPVAHSCPRRPQQTAQATLAIQHEHPNISKPLVDLKDRNPIWDSLSFWVLASCMRPYKKPPAGRIFPPEPNMRWRDDQYNHLIRKKADSGWSLIIHWTLISQKQPLQHLLTTKGCPLWHNMAQPFQTCEPPKSRLPTPATESWSF